MRWPLLVVATVVVLAWSAPVGAAPRRRQPNIVLILADDLDVYVGGTQLMNRTKSLLNGAVMENAFVTTPVCCPSRAAYVSSRYGHNTVVPTGGCMHQDVTSSAYVTRTVATALHSLNYTTGLFGKYMNGPTCTCPAPECTVRPGGSLTVPPGWDRWFAACKLGQYFNNTWNNDSVPVATGSSDADYMTSVIGNASVAWLRQSLTAAPDTPVFAYVAPHAPHISDNVFPYYTTPAPWYDGAVPANATSVRTPNWNARAAGAHALIANQPALDVHNVAFSDASYRRRVEATMSIDDLVEGVVAALRDVGQLDNTYVFFTSDHGYSLGQLRLPTGKWNLYENDIRVPALARGPDMAGVTVAAPIGNVDYAPTFVELAGGDPTDPRYGFDGRSMVPLWRQRHAAPAFRTAYLIAYWSLGRVMRGAPVNASCNPRDGVTEPGCPVYFHEEDGDNNTYAGLRVVDAAAGHNLMYAEVYASGPHVPLITNFTAATPVFYELYNLTADPWQLANVYPSAAGSPLVATLRARLHQQLQCRGATCD